jgi:hypothetical protein
MVELGPRPLRPLGQRLGVGRKRSLMRQFTQLPVSALSPRTHSPV